MKAIDFNYNGILASDWGIMICKFDSSNGIETLEYGSNISFNTIPIQNGRKYALANTSYDQTAEYTFQICKASCGSDVTPFTVEEQRRIARWLNRNDGFFPLRIIQEGYENIYFEGSFNLSPIQFKGEVYGYELQFITNRPFGLFDKERYFIHITTSGQKFYLEDSSDEIGFIYPKMRITCRESGELRICNSVENRTTVISNCQSGEVITFDESLLIESSVPSHKLYNDFNYVFPRIANTYDNKMNILSISLPCDIEIEYNPIVKGVGL